MTPQMESLRTALTEIVGEGACLSRPEELFVYECDGLTLDPTRPQLVVFPRTTEHVAAIVKACRRHETPFVPRGAGTGLSGGAHASADAVVIEISRMNEILEVDVENRFAVIQPGLVNLDLSKAVEKHGLHYAPDPSSQQACTIGGNVAENSGGPHTLKYGATTDSVLALEVVLADGEVVRIGDASGHAPGYDLVGAMTGSEGTLGIITEATVRLLPIPERIETLLVIFQDVVSACEAVGEIVRSGLVPAALEILDQRTVEIVEDSAYAAGLPRDAGAVLLAELDGAPAALGEQVERVSNLCREKGAREVRIAKDEEERALFWKARKGSFGAMGRLAPDLYVHDAVVPRARLPEIIAQVMEIAGATPNRARQRLPRRRREPPSHHLLRSPGRGRTRPGAGRGCRDPRGVHRGGGRAHRRTRSREGEAGVHGAALQRRGPRRHAPPAPRLQSR